MKLSNLTIGARLYTGFAIVLGLCGTLALVAWLQVQRIGTIVNDINDSWVVSIVQLNEMNDALANIRRSELRSVLSVNPKVVDAEEAYRAEQFKRLEDQAKPYEATGISGPPERKLYDQFRAELQSHQQTWATLLPLARGGAEQHAKAVEFLLGESKQRFDKASAALRTDVKFNVEGATTAKNSSKDALSTGATAIVTTMLVIVAVSLLFAWWVTRSIVSPLHAAIGVARNIATGDLSRAVNTTGKDETGQLLAALGDMQSKLRSTLRGIQESADQVGTASTQIASGNSDLSMRTEQQASSLQETASSVEQLTTTVTHSADSARQANELAGSATRLAEQGGEVVAKVVDTMNGISTSSKRISDIIGVIDGIAFQTNILALNAAVEAARAGEQGRGFAVVATEVRTLAQRSAQAAKEIKTLIQDSVDRVDVGGQLVQQAGLKMSEVVDSIRSVTVLISEVSTAASEQTSGIRLVNTSVNDLDKTTQQNAALVEESAAAAESLKEQALTLSRAVNQFKLTSA